MSCVVLFIIILMKRLGLSGVNAESLSKMHDSLLPLTFNWKFNKKIKAEKLVKQNDHIFLQKYSSDFYHKMMVNYTLLH